MTELEPTSASDWIPVGKREDIILSSHDSQANFNAVRLQRNDTSITFPRAPPVIIPLEAPTDRREPVTIPSLPWLTELKKLRVVLLEVLTILLPFDF